MARHLCAVGIAGLCLLSVAAGVLHSRSVRDDIFAFSATHLWQPENASYADRGYRTSVVHDQHCPSSTSSARHSRLQQLQSSIPSILTPQYMHALGARIAHGDDVLRAPTYMYIRDVFGNIMRKDTIPFTGEGRTWSMKSFNSTTIMAFVSVVDSKDDTHSNGAVLLWTPESDAQHMITTPLGCTHEVDYDYRNDLFVCPRNAGPTLFDWNGEIVAEGTARTHLESRIEGIIDPYHANSVTVDETTGDIYIGYRHVQTCLFRRASTDAEHSTTIHVVWCTSGILHHEHDKDRWYIGHGTVGYSDGLHSVFVNDAITNPVQYLACIRSANVSTYTKQSHDQNLGFNGYHRANTDESSDLTADKCFTLTGTLGSFVYLMRYDTPTDQLEVLQRIHLTGEFARDDAESFGGAALRLTASQYIITTGRNRFSDKPHCHTVIALADADGVPQRLFELDMPVFDVTLSLQSPAILLQSVTRAALQVKGVQCHFVITRCYNFRQHTTGTLRIDLHTTDTFSSARSNITRSHHAVRERESAVAEQTPFPDSLVHEFEFPPNTPFVHVTVALGGVLDNDSVRSLTVVADVSDCALTTPITVMFS